MKMLRHALLYIFFGILTQSLQAQNWDYEKYPAIDADYIHLNADFRFNENGLIEGDILYNARIKNDRTDSLKLHATGLNINHVLVNNAEAEYRISDDQLIIYLDNNRSSGDEINLRIQYDTEPVFGVHRNGSGTMWTSQLPKTTRHWLPVFDHPRNEFTTEFKITHSTEHTIITNGRRGNSDLLTVDDEVTTFTSDAPIAATSLAWAVGNLPQITSTRDGSGLSTNDPQIYLYAESENNETNLLEETVTAFQRVKDDLGMNYPYRDLHIVVLDEDFWEVNTESAGVLFVYKNKENLIRQIQQGIIGQWIGSHIRPEQWSDADAINILKADLASRLFDFEYELTNDNQPYESFSTHELSLWQNYIETGDLDHFIDDLQRVKGQLFANESKILDWNTLSMMIYEETGQPYFDGFTPVEIETETVEPIVYTARVEWEEGATTAEVHFEAESGPVPELVSVQIEEITINDVRQHEATFTGQNDGVVINVSATIENIIISLDERDDIIIIEQKPLYFWLHQLRYHEDTARRVEAAEAFARFPENPDLQLALNDILHSETEPEVFAAILSSMSELTSGASGTDERFIQFTSTDQPPIVQKASVEALSNYEGNERVISRLQNIITQTNHEDVRRKAIHSLANITDSGRFNSIVQNLITRESVLYEVPLFIELLAEKGEEERAVEIASTFVSSEFPYPVRQGALEAMLRFDQSPTNWAERLPRLLADNHPRIRYQAADALQRLSSQQRRQIIDQQIENEYDARVIQVLR